MKQYNYESIDEHIQWLIKMMDTEYPNNYELVVNSNGATLKSNQMELSFLANHLKGKMGFTNIPNDIPKSDNPYQE